MKNIARAAVGLVAFVPAATALLKATPAAADWGTCPPPQNVSGCNYQYYRIDSSEYNACCSGVWYDCYVYSNIPGGTIGEACGDYCTAYGTCNL